MKIKIESLQHSYDSACGSDIPSSLLFPLAFLLLTVFHCPLSVAQQYSMSHPPSASNRNPNFLHPHIYAPSSHVLLHWGPYLDSPLKASSQNAAHFCVLSSSTFMFFWTIPRHRFETPFIFNPIFSLLFLIVLDWWQWKQWLWELG